MKWRLQKIDTKGRAEVAAELVPVIRGTMGGRDYYVGKMSFQDLAAKVQFFNELDKSPDLDNLLQRQLSNRAAEMTDYLLRQPERFYGAIIVAAWGGRPQYIRVKMEDHPLLEDTFEFGLLRFDGRQEYFALDGQHRLKSIKTAIDRDPSLRHEEVSVVFVTHERTEEGNIRTRRLFHTLNRYAKPTTIGQNVALDEDNVVSISTRMLLKSGVKLLDAERLELKRQNLTKAQDSKFTSLAALYNFNRSVLEAVYGFRRERDYLRYRPDASHVEAIYNAVSSLWIEMCDRFDEFQAVESNTRTPGELREPEGDPARGHLMFRPLGLRIYGDVIAQAVAEQTGMPARIGAELDPEVWTKALDRVDGLPLTLGKLPWRGTVFRNDRMEIGARMLAIKLACYMLELGDVDRPKLLAEYRGHLESEKARLPPVIG